MDKRATIPPSGMADTLFVKFNLPFGFGDETLWGGYNDVNNMLFVFTPTMHAPKETFQVRGFRNFLSDEQVTPFNEGDIVRIVNLLGFVDVSKIKSEFFL